MAPRQKAWGQIMTTDMPETDVVDEGGETEGGLARRTVLRVGAVGGVGLGLATAQGLVVPVAAAEGPVVDRRGVRRVGDRDRRRAPLHRGVPDQPADPGAVQRRAAHPEGARARATDYQDWDQPPGPGPGQQNSLGNERHQIWPSPDRPGYPGPDRLQDRPAGRRRTLHHSQVLPIDKGGKPTVSFDADGKTYRRGRHADAADEHDLRLQRHLPRADDQRRVRQAGAGPVREPPRREPATTWTGRTSAPRTSRS